MSSRLAGRRVSMAPNRVRRSKRDASIFPGLEEEPGRNAGRHKNAIFNDEIARLLIREEDLVKVSQQARVADESAVPYDPCSRVTSDDPSAQPSYHRVAVRREIPESERQPPLRRIVLLRRTASDASAAAVDFRGSSGPRLDSRGRVVAHSLLGRPEEFYRMGLLRGHLRPEDVPQQYRSDEGVRRGMLTSAARAAADHPSETRGHALLCADRPGTFECHRTPERSVVQQLPDLETEDEKGCSTRESQRDILRRIGSSTQRLTEQVNQCAIASPMKHATDSCCSDWEAVWRKSPSTRTPTPLGPGFGVSNGTDALAASAVTRSVVKMSGPQYSFIGGWSYQKEALLG